jgi:MoxR-like ATPase
MDTMNDPIEHNENIVPSTVENTMSPNTAKVQRIKDEVAKVIVGQDELVELMIISMLCDGHVLLEGVPGIAKTLAAKTLAKSVDTGFSRIQFTSDLMPSDILGTSVFNMKESTFRFNKGPIFSNIILIDEINRAPAKTQSALFEVMEEKQISIDGTMHTMEFPFLIIATQNPIEQEGTYRLPEAQLDRFFIKVSIDYPSFAEEVNILHRFKNQVGTPDLSHVEPVCTIKDIKDLQSQIANIYTEEHIIDYIVKIVQETRQHGKIYLGASPRSTLAILRASKAVALISGRDFVIPDDIQYVAPHILNHRIILTPDAEMSGMTPYKVIEQILREVEVPR